MVMNAVHEMQMSDRPAYRYHITKDRNILDFDVWFRPYDAEAVFACPFFKRLLYCVNPCFILFRCQLPYDFFILSSCFSKEAYVFIFHVYPAKFKVRELTGLYGETMRRQ